MAQEDLSRFIVEGVFLNIVGVAGLLGNALSVLVMSQPQMRCSFNFLLEGLAASDSVLILTSILLLGMDAIYPYTGYLKNYYINVRPLISPYLYGIAYIAQTMSIYLTLIVTVERWLAVCHPFRALRLCTYSNACKCVMGTTVFAIAYNIPKFFEVVVRKSKLNTGEAIYIVDYDLQFRTDTYIVVYIYTLSTIVVYVVPFLVLVVFNTYILSEVWRAQTERAQMSRVRRSEIGLAIVLLVIIAVFLLCNGLALFLNTLEVFLGSAVIQKDYKLLIYISNLLIVINHSVNFIIYVIFSKNFKRRFRKMFCITGNTRSATIRNNSYRMRN